MSNLSNDSKENRAIAALRKDFDDAMLSERDRDLVIKMANKVIHNYKGKRRAVGAFNQLVEKEIMKEGKS